MSDIFVKTDGLGSTGWKKATSIFVKTAGLGSTGWRSAIGVWIKNATQWLKVWPLSGVFATRRPWIGDNSTTQYADRKTSSGAIRIGSNYYGNNAQWDANGWVITGYTYKWNYYLTELALVPEGQIDSGSGSGWTTTSGQDLLPTTVWTQANANLLDTLYLSFQVTATASNSAYNGVSESDKIKVVRQQPLNISKSLSSYTPEENVEITYSSSWDSSIARKIDTTRTTIYWYKNTVSATTGGTYVGSGYSYTPGPNDVNHYLYAVETSYNSGTDFDLGISNGVEAKEITTSKVAAASFQKTGSQRRIQLPSNFTQGTDLYISTNGFITWGYDPGSARTMPTSGITLAPLLGDLRQGVPTGDGSVTSTGGLWVYADATNFYVRWEGNYFNEATELAEYQVKFYWNEAYADVYFINNSLTTITPSTTAVQNGNTIYKTWGQSTAQTSTLLNTASMTKISIEDGTDDYRSLVTAALPPGNVTSVVNRNFTTGKSHLFLTTGVNTTNVKVKYTSTLNSNFTIGPITNGTASSHPYQIIHDILPYLTSRTWTYDTYNKVGSVTTTLTYTRNSEVWYAGNQYRGKDVGFSGFIPTNTTYWGLSSTNANPWSSSVSYPSGALVWYAGAVYASGLPSTNVTPTTGGDFWYFQYNFANTYNSSTTYLTSNTVRYNGSTYSAKSLTWSSILPTNTTYWDRITTVTYNVGDYVYYNDVYYFCTQQTSGTYPTNASFWFGNYFPLYAEITPYNGALPGTPYSDGSSIFIRINAVSDPVAISVAPTFSNITSSTITATYTQSVYTNRIVIDVKRPSPTIINNPLESLIGYPYTKITSGATEYTEALTSLAADTRHYFYLTPRYLYNSGYGVYFDGAQVTADEKTLQTLSAPTPGTVTFTYPSTASFSFTGGSGPYYQIYWKTSSSAPSNTSTYYDAAGNDSPITDTITPAQDSTYYFWVRSSTQNIADTTTSGNATEGTFSNWSSTSSSIIPFKKPASLTASSNSNTKIALEWSGGAGEDYQVYWTTGDSFVPTNQQTYADLNVGSGTTYDWTGMTRGTTYYFFIRSRIGTSTYSDWYPTAFPGITGKAKRYAPGVPTSPSATVDATNSSSEIDLSWTAPTTTSTRDAASGYDVYYSTDTTDPTSTTSATTSTTSTSLAVTGLTANTDYYFWVRAYNDDNTGSDASAWTTRFTAKTAAAKPVNSSAPTISTDSTDYKAGAKISIGEGTWTGASSYKKELLFSSSTPVADTSGSKTLDSNGDYVVTLSDASNPSYYFRSKVTAYSGANQTGASAVAYSSTTTRSYISNPSTTISAGTATSSGFTISGTVGPSVTLFGTTTYFSTISEIQIWNSAQTAKVATITTGLPSVNASGNWSYVWTGGSATTTYYAKAVAKAIDSAGTTSTSAFSNSVTTTSAFVTPTPGVPASFIFSRNLDGTTGTSRRNWFWNVSSGMGSYSYVIYDLYVWDQTTQPTATGTTGFTWYSTYGSSTTSAPVTNSSNFNFSSTSTPSYRTMARGSTFNGDNGTNITTRSTASWGKARCRVIATNGTTYGNNNDNWTVYR